MSNHTPAPGQDGPASARARHRTLFRVLGIVSMGIAITLIAISFYDFFTFGSETAAETSSGAPFDIGGMDEGVDEGPTKMWMFFVALPFFLAGGFLLNLGFAGAHAKYMAGEYSSAIQSVSRDLGMRSEASGAGPYCRSCGTQNDADARFCDSCGASMGA
ncbi:MAG: zinc ribbon domain-containing protein [Actinomycetota bacterium]